MDPYICYEHVWESIKKPVWILTHVQLECNRLSQRVSISVQILGIARTLRSYTNFYSQQSSFKSEP